MKPLFIVVIVHRSLFYLKISSTSSVLGSTRHLCKLCEMAAENNEKYFKLILVTKPEIRWNLIIREGIFRPKFADYAM